MNTDSVCGSDVIDRVKVGVADYAVAAGETTITTSGLGSCVGIALADPEAKVGGLAHVMLPEPTESARETKPAKAVPTAVEQLLAAVEEAGAKRDRIEAKLTGGSKMLEFSGIGDAVGERNVEQSRETLAEFDIELVAEDVGGDYGRSIELHPGEWTLTVKSAHEGVVEL